EDDAVDRRRRAVRRKIFLPRRARDPPTPPRCVIADRTWRLLRRRPAGAWKDYQGRRVPRGARASPRAVFARNRPGKARRAGGESRPRPVTERPFLPLLAISVENP